MHCPFVLVIVLQTFSCHFFLANQRTAHVVLNEVICTKLSTIDFSAQNPVRFEALSVGAEILRIVIHDRAKRCHVCSALCRAQQGSFRVDIISVLVERHYLTFGALLAVAELRRLDPAV